MATTKDLQERIDQLEQLVYRLTGRPAAKLDAPAPQTDFVERGGEEHAALLGLKKAGDADPIQMDGWALEDVTMYGPTATKDFLMQILRQKINELTMPMPEVQSVDPRKPHFAPLMWRPGIPFRQITE